VRGQVGELRQFFIAAAELGGKIFQRLHNSNYPGSGMGLAICHRIINSYGGTIRAISEPGQGSTFYFTVPAAREEDGPNHGSRS